MTHQKKIGSRSSEIFRKRTLSRELIGLFLMRSSIGVGVLIGYLYLEFRKLLDMFHYSF
ncbi:hypothetical protein PVK06_020862 [Gossypium arboreum]|uniref:Uncharacterized protein n=1 Tax=Gossypium arboreum TaxID=29729 RepID=A0ABR0PNF1_GOSAR|nr:hypothetical protein PVK06_020862 [Gossypium arboreum]